jgi:hypothetical protein
MFQRVIVPSESPRIILRNIRSCNCGDFVTSNSADEAAAASLLEHKMLQLVTLPGSYTDGHRVRS